MISKGSLVCFTACLSRFFVVITEPYGAGAWSGGETQVVDIYGDFGIRTANVEHLTVISQ